MELKLYIYAEWDSWKKQYDFSAYTFEWTDSKKVLIETRHIECTPPPDNVLQAGTVAAYKAEQAKIRAEAHAKVGNIQKQIEELLCIEHKAAA